MKKVITYGTFDLLHAGHINLLRRAKELGDYLIVVVSTDEFNWNEKQKRCYFSYEERKKLVEAVRYVDLVLPEENWEQKLSDIKEYKVDTFVMGDDWKEKFDFLKKYCDVIYLPRTEGISTTKIKQELTILLGLQEDGVKNFSVKPIDKNISPTLYEIKKNGVRVFYYIDKYDKSINITYITENKQKNKTEQKDKKTAVKREKRMLKNPDIHKEPI